MKEKWLPVVGYEGLYEVSDQGRVRSLRKNIIMKNSPLQAGYRCVWLYRDGCVKNQLVSRAVLTAFKGAPPSPKHQAAHWDRNLLNNALKNLRWATPSENDKDKDRHGTRTIVRGEAVGRKVLVETDIERIRDLRAAGCTLQQIADWIRTTNSNVCVILQRKTWAHVS